MKIPIILAQILNPQTWPGIVSDRIKPNVSGFELISERMLHDPSLPPQQITQTSALIIHKIMLSLIQ